MQVTGAAIGLAMVVSGVVVSASPAAAASDPWESQSGIYHYFTVPKSSVPSNTCGNSTGAGAELEGNIGPSGTWAAVGLDASGENCVANIGPMKPGLYYYQYVATMPDRSKQVFRNPNSSVDVTSHPNWNTLFVPGPEVAWMDDVASGGGTVSELTYTSTVAGAERSAWVWTPPAYDPGRAKPYPVLYLLAGEGQSAREWQELGRARQILDNLAVSGDLASMVVVMADPGDTHYRAELLNNILPAVQHQYNVSTSGRERAIAGIGRGGYQALNLALTDPGAFGSIGSMSGYLPGDACITRSLAKAVNKGTDLIRFYVGNTLDPSYNSTWEAMQKLRSAGVDFEFDGVHPETGGVWDTWRENLRDFASRVFRPGAARHRGMSEGHRALTEPYRPPATGSITTPHIDANGMVTFETGTQWADAKDVVIWGDWAPNGQWFRIPMTKVGDRWRTTIGPIDGYYYWRYEVNGTPVHDPEDTNNTENVESQLFVPGGERTPLLADVPADEAGDITLLEYTSAYPGNPTMKFKVWTPPDYDPDRAEKYPVLYLYHGFAQNYATWTEVGRAKQILDNLYVRGEIAPMVVVMPGYPGLSDFWVDLTTKVMPLTASEFNISTEPSKMALAGLSWGARGTQGALVNHPGAFSYFGIFSPPFAAGSLDDISGPAAKKGTKLVSLFAGDVDAGAIGAINGMEANLAAYDIPTVKTIVPGPHGFDVWWQGLSDFLPRIFEHSSGVTIRPEAADFGTLPEGYHSPPAKKLTVINSRQTAIPPLSVTVSGPNADKFTLSTDTLAPIRAGKKAHFRVAPVTGLPAGVYEATVTVAGGSVRASVPVRVKVAKA
ncbi:alpha/beta hydrolase-fold protein [Sphaerobacter sp.]|uniref:alpha/beta hydrolase-fold protein n=1 Tax=Sphaerobacter sp. TaxID=2099654 RepID=UPI001E15C4F7|nr:alpha/beta hydrolase-fold protein [Sphaerobacter sp.]MBX5446654.1 esterase [Sphaerobacter sp.]